MNKLIILLCLAFSTSLKSEKCNPSIDLLQQISRIDVELLEVGNPPSCVTDFSLFVEDSIQLKIWEEGDKKTQEILERILKEDEITDIKILGGGKYSTYKVTFKSGLKGVFKPFNHYPEINGSSSVTPMSLQGQLSDEQEVRREVAAYEIDKMLNLKMVPTTVMREYKGTIGSMQFFFNKKFVYDKEHAKTIANEISDKIRASDDLKKVDSLSKEQGKIEDTYTKHKQSENLRFLDYILMNADRHDGNYLIRKDNKHYEVAIDHGKIFSRAPPFLFQSVPQLVTPTEVVRSSLMKLTPTEIYSKLCNLNIPDEDIRQLISRIQEAQKFIKDKKK